MNLLNRFSLTAGPLPAALALALVACTPSSPSPPADLEVLVEAEPEEGLAPLTVRLSSSITGGTGEFNYDWDLGDGTTADDESVVHIYEVAGEFTVTLEVTDSQGGTGQGEVTIVVGDDHTPVASASASPDRGIAPLTVTFTGSGMGGDAPLSYRWSFGDGSDEATQQNPSHTYDTPGTYNATLVVTDDDGDQAEASVEVEVFDNTVPVVEITAEPTNGISPLTVSFNAVVSGGDAPLSFAWDFGDDETSMIQSPSHTFEGGGAYTVTVTVTDANGDESSDDIVITVGDDETPSVTASVTPDSGLAPLAVSFSAAVAGGNEPYTYSWDFGDSSPNGEVQNPAHTYSEAGTYTATVIVTDADGDTASDTATVAVGSDDAPSATANATPLSGIEPLTVSFSGVGVGGNPPLSYQWNFGDGSDPAATATPTHTYESAGTYNATLIVTDDDGDSASDSVRIEVASNEVPVVEASADTTGGIEPLSVSFTASVAGGDLPLTYDWDFGDESPHSTRSGPSHTYSEGSWTATVTVTDDNGDSDSDTVTIIVGGDNVPSVTASAVPTSGHAPLPVSFSSTVTGGNSPFTYNWNFGDGSSSTDQNPSHTFELASTYTVSVTVTDVDGDVANDTVEVAVADDALPVATASASPISGVAPLTVSFFGDATGGDAPLSYEWTFGDGTPASTEQNPSHTYSAGGTFTATLIVRDDDGDSDSETVTIEVSDDGVPVTFVNATPVNGLLPLTVDLTCGASGGNAPLNYQWTFGDGSPTDEAPTTSHRYESAGTFTATCTVTDADGDSDSDTIDIHVGDTEVPAVSASVTPAAGRVPLDVAFAAEVVGGTAPYNFTWNFGDGSADSSEQNPSHTYDTVGVYTATVRVTDFEGDSATATVDVSVLETASDLLLTDFSYDVTDVITYTVTVTNDGPDATQSFHIDLYYDQAEAPAPGEFGQDYEYVADTIEPGASLTRTFTRLVEPLSQQAWAQVDPGELISDPDRTNNVMGPLDVTVDIVRINEVYFDSPGSDGETAFVEIHATPGRDLSGYTIVGVNGSNGESYDSFTLPADTVVPEDALLVVADGEAVENWDVSGLFNPQNGPDSIQLLDPSDAVVDAVAYGEFSDTEFPAGEGSPAALAPAGSTVGRGQDQPDTNNNEVDFLILAPTPGVHNHFANDTCTDPFDLALNLASIGSTVGYTSDSVTGGATGCTEGVGDGPDAVFLLDLATATSVHLDTEGSDFDTVLYLRTTCDDVSTEVACDDDSGDGLTSSLDLDLEAGTYYVFVDGYFSSTDGVFILNYWTL